MSTITLEIFSERKYCGGGSELPEDSKQIGYLEHLCEEVDVSVILTEVTLIPQYT